MTVKTATIERKMNMNFQEQRGQALLKSSSSLQYQTAYMTLLVPATVPRGKGLKGAIIMGAFLGLRFDCKGMRIKNWCLVNQCALLQQRIFLSKRNLNFPKAAPESSSFLPAVSSQAMPLNRIDLVLSCAIHALKLSS